MREKPDRRRQPTPMLSRYTFYGRRKAFRRNEDRLRGGYVDRYGPTMFALLIWIVAMNVLDAVFTRMILDRGGTELNPVADWAIRVFGDYFVLWKLGVISFSLLLLCLHCHFRMAKSIIFLAVILYSGVVLYQVVLLSCIP